MNAPNVNSTHNSRNGDSEFKYSMTDIAFLNNCSNAPRMQKFGSKFKTLSYYQDKGYKWLRLIRQIDQPSLHETLNDIKEKFPKQIGIQRESRLVVVMCAVLGKNLPLYMSQKIIQQQKSFL
ncbi:hypothetical protein TNCT_251531 [Trichonephila clavata]|uniref:Uncharacterized protein n=1 Tax=Trichonephila clavata TaxID=2740835 RepID=A0A8X6JGY0_TRICU|nr:hypothetical protein TNCT_251531 [Trichonephila clavata]